MLRELVTQVPEQADLSAAKYNPYSLRFSLYYIAEIVKFYKDDHSISHEHVNSSMNSIRFFKDRVPPPL